MEASRFWGFCLRVLLTVILAVPGFSAVAHPKIIDLFTPFEGLERSAAVGSGSAPELALPSSNVRRLRQVEVNPAFSQAGRVKPGDIILVNPFPGVRFEAAVERVRVYGGQTVTVRARLQEPSEGYLLVSTTNGRSLGSLEIPGTYELYSIVPDPSGPGHYVAELDLRDVEVPDLANDALVPPAVPKPFPDLDTMSLSATESSDETVSIDLMVVYTPAAREWAASAGGVANIISRAVEIGQLVLDNSQTGVELRLVHSAEVDYVESGHANIDLYRLTASPDFNPWGDQFEGYSIAGHMDEVHRWRNDYRADLVALLVRRTNDDDEAGGVGWLPDSASGSPEYGFSVTYIEYAGFYTFIHELGHNMGCGHHREQLKGPGPGLFPYSAGWRWVGNDGGRYCSVMTYWSGSYFSDGMDHIRVPYFSNPAVAYAGVPTGHPELADNARTIRTVKNVIANYRRSIYDSVPMLEPQEGVFHSPVRVTVSCSSPWVVMRYTLDGRTPALSDPVIPSGGALVIDSSQVLKVKAWSADGRSSRVVSGSYRLVPETPLVSPAGGVLVFPKRVTFACATPGAVIRYTTNGLDPTESDPVAPSGAASLVIDRSMVLKARAWREGWEPSEVKTVVFRDWKRKSLPRRRGLLRFERQSQVAPIGDEPREVEGMPLPARAATHPG